MAQVEKNMQFIFFKKFIVLRRKRSRGLQNGVSRLFLAAFQVQVLELVFFLIIILNIKFLNNFPIQREYSL